MNTALVQVLIPTETRKQQEVLLEMLKNYPEEIKEKWTLKGKLDTLDTFNQTSNRTLVEYNPSIDIIKNKASKTPKDNIDTLDTSDEKAMRGKVYLNSYNQKEVKRNEFNKRRISIYESTRTSIKRCTI